MYTEPCLNIPDFLQASLSLLGPHMQAGDTKMPFPATELVPRVEAYWAQCVKTAKAHLGQMGLDALLNASKEEGNEQFDKTLRAAIAQEWLRRTTGAELGGSVRCQDVRGYAVVIDELEAVYLNWDSSEGEPELCVGLVGKEKAARGRDKPKAQVAYALASCVWPCELELNVAA